MIYDNSGSLSKNSNKKTPNHPDWRGTIQVNGTYYFLSMWDKEIKTQDGRTFPKKDVSLQLRDLNRFPFKNAAQYELTGQSYQKQQQSQQPNQPMHQSLGQPTYQQYQQQQQPPQQAQQPYNQPPPQQFDERNPPPHNPDDDLPF